MFRFLILAALLFAPLTTGFAQAAESPRTPQELVAELPTADFERKTEIVNALAASGHPRAGLIIGALGAGTLFSSADGKIVLQTSEDGKSYSDALTGNLISGLSEDQLTKIGVNNRLRRDLRGLSARLSLMSLDPQTRRKSAADAFTAHDPETLPAIEEAMKKESVPSIRQALDEARAAIVLQSDDSSQNDKLTAVNTLRARGDRDALNALLGLRTADSQTLRNAAAAAVKDVESSLAYWGALQNVYYGLSLGSVLLLAAIGLAITFGVMGVINMAHGEMIMLGAYTTYMVQQVLASAAPALMPWALPLAIPMAFLVAGATGILIERSIIRFLYGRPLETLLATWGLSLLMQQGVRTIFGPTKKPVTAPTWMSGSFDIGHLTITFSRLAIIIFALAAFSLLTMFLKRTHFGMQMRAVTQNRKMASAMGVRTNWVDALTFGLGAACVGAAGSMLVLIIDVTPPLGPAYTLLAFVIVITGGLGSMPGALLGGVLIGLTEAMAGLFFTPSAKSMFSFGLLVLVLLFRPQGILGKRLS